LHGFTIVQVSDLYNTEFGESQSRLLSVIKNAAPDLIAVTTRIVEQKWYSAVDWETASSKYVLTTDQN